MLSDTGTQALWLAKQHGPQNGDMPVPWGGGGTGTRVYQWQINHSDVQALWSLGWAVHLGYEDFGPLFDAMANGYFKFWEAFGPQMTLVDKPMVKQNKVTPFQTLDEAIEAVRGEADPYGPDNPFVNFVWQEERFIGTISALSQYFGGRWTESAQRYTEARQQYRPCFRFNRDNPEAAKALGCGRTLKFGTTGADWMMAIGPAANQ